MKIYNYDELGVYTESTFASIVLGDEIIPSNATKITPPNPTSGKVAVFDEAAQTWSLQIDKRGNDIWDIQTQEKTSVDYLGKIKTGFTASEPPSAAHIWASASKKWILTTAKIAEIKQQQQQAIWRGIKLHREKVKAGGVMVNVEGVNKWFHSDAASRVQILGLVNMATANAIPANLQWKTMDGSFVTMTAAMSQAIFTAISTLDIDTFAIAEQHRASMLVNESPDKYDYGSGWAAVYVS